MRINVMSVMVDDQAKALRFYTEVLGFVKKREIPLGEHSWLTVVSPEAPYGTELFLEPDEHPASWPFKEALVEAGIPFTSFAVDDVAAEYDRLEPCGRALTRPVLAGLEWMGRPNVTIPTIAATGLFGRRRSQWRQPSAEAAAGSVRKSRGRGTGGVPSWTRRRTAAR